jgi:hypothetical protein
LAGGVRNLKGAKRTSEEERASAGRGCSERGTLNASTVENPIWSYLQGTLLAATEMKPIGQELSFCSVRTTNTEEIAGRFQKRSTNGQNWVEERIGLEFIVRQLLQLRRT